MARTPFVLPPAPQARWFIANAGLRHAIYDRNKQKLSFCPTFSRVLLEEEGVVHELCSVSYDQINFHFSMALKLNGAMVPLSRLT
jgi:hypothetical protein